MDNINKSIKILTAVLIAFIILILLNTVIKITIIDRQSKLIKSQNKLIERQNKYIQDHD